MPSLTLITTTLLIVARATMMTADPAAAPAMLADDVANDSLVGQIYDMRDMPLLVSSADNSGPDSGASTALIDQLCEAIRLPCTHVAPGLVWVEGTHDQQQLLQSSLERIRALYMDRYEIQLVAISMEADRAPEIGAKVDMTHAMYATRQVVSASQPVAFQCVTTHRYVKGYEPVVSDSVFAYSTVVDDATSGMTATLAVDPTRALEGGISIDVKGNLTNVDFARTMPFTMGDHPMLIDLPTFGERTFESHLTLQFGQLTALSVVNDFKNDGAIVIAAMVKKVK